MRATLIVALVLLAAPLAGCVVPENMTALREDLGYASVDLPDVVAKARASTLTPRVQEPVTLTADVEGIALRNATIHWSVDGEQAAGRTIERSFGEPGPVPVNLTVEGPEGTAAHDALTLEVRENAVPVPAISIEDAGSLTEGDRVTISGLGSADADGDALTYTWVVDGEQVSTEPQFERTVTAGVHEVKLVVGDGLEESVAFDSYAVARPIAASGEATVDDPVLPIPLDVQEGASGLEATLVHSSHAGVDDVQLVLVGPDGDEVAASRGAPEPGASQGEETIAVDGDALVPGSYSLQARLDRGASATVTIEGVLTYSALARPTST